MKPALAIGQLGVPTKTNISNCHLIARDNECLFSFPDAPGSGAGYVNLNGYLICPLEMFTPRQLKAARKKYYAALNASSAE
jgi:hypothetical protein